MEDSSARAIELQKLESPESTEITVRTPLLSRVESPNIEPLKETNSGVKAVQPPESSKGKESSKNGCDNSAYTAENKPQKIERISSAGTSVGNSNDVASSYSDLKVVKEKLSTSIDSRSKLSSVDVS